MRGQKRIIAGVLLIDRFRAYEDKKRYQQDLKRQARSKSDKNAVDAIEIIRDEGWLDGGIELLAGARLKGANLKNADLRGAVLRKTDISSDATLDEADLRNAVLTEAKMCRSHFDRTKFAGADLSGVDFSGATLLDCTFLKDDPQGKDVLLQGAQFEEATIEKINFSHLQMEKISFRFAELEDVIFHGTILEEADFTGADLKRVEFVEAKLSYASFAFFGEESKWATNENSRKGQLQGVSFKKATLKSAYLGYMTFVEVDFQGADLSNANCQSSAFRGKTNLCGANLYNMRVENASFVDVLIDAHTQVFDGKTVQDVWNEAWDEYSGELNTENPYQPIEGIFSRILKQVIDKFPLNSFIARVSVNILTAPEQDETGSENDNLKTFEEHSFTFKYISQRNPEVPLRPPSDSISDTLEYDEDF